MPTKLGFEARAASSAGGLNFLLLLADEVQRQRRNQVKPAVIEIRWKKPVRAFGQRPDMFMLAAAPLAMKKTMTTAPASEE